MNTFTTTLGQQQSLKIQLDNKERGYYAGLHQQADPHDTNKIGGVQAVQFFKRSGVPVETLKRIWLLSSTNGETLSREEFYIALKLISYAQNNIEVSRENISRQIPSPLPKFQFKIAEEPQIDENIFKIHPQQEQNYNQYAKQLDPYESNSIQTSLAMQMFLKSQLSESQIQQIINLIDPSINNKIKITIPQYKVIVHLISLHRQGIALPPVLPNCLQQVLKPTIEQDKIQPIPKLSPTSQINLVTQIPPGVQKQTQSESAFSSFGNFGSFETTFHSQPKIQLESQLQFNTEQQKSISQNNEQKSTLLQSEPKIKDDKYSAFDILDIDKISQQDTQPIKKIDLLSDNVVKLDSQVNKIQTNQKTENFSSKSSDFSDFQQIDLIASQKQTIESNNTPSTSQSIKLNQELKELQQNIQNDYYKLKPEFNKIQTQQTANFQDNIQDLNVILDTIKICNAETLKQREAESDEIKSFLSSFQEIQKKINNEQEFFQQEIKEVEDKRLDVIHGLNRTIIEINNSLGINVKTRIEVKKKNTNVIDDISNYAQNLIQDININVSNAHQQQLKRDEQISKELQEQRQLILSLEKQVKSLAIKIDQISVRPLSNIEFSDQLIRKEEKLQKLDILDFPRQSNFVKENQSPQSFIQTPMPQLNEKPQKVDEIRNKFNFIEDQFLSLNIDLNKQQTIESEFQINNNVSKKQILESELQFNEKFIEQQAKLDDLELDNQQDPNSGIDEKKQNQVDDSEIWSKITEQSQQFIKDNDLGVNKIEIQSVPIIKNDDQFDENKHESPKTEFNSQGYFLSMENNQQQQQDDKVLWRNPEIQVMSPHVEQDTKSPKDVQIEFDFNAQFGQSEWNEFNQNFFGGFGSQQVQTQQFGFEESQKNQNVPKIDDFSSFNW